jgi:hypothetical protein
VLTASVCNRGPPHSDHLQPGVSSTCPSPSMHCRLHQQGSGPLSGIPPGATTSSTHAGTLLHHPGAQLTASGSAPAAPSVPHPPWHPPPPGWGPTLQPTQNPPWPHSAAAYWGPTLAALQLAGVSNGGGPSAGSANSSVHGGPHANASHSGAALQISRASTAGGPDHSPFADPAGMAGTPGSDRNSRSSSHMLFGNMGSQDGHSNRASPSSQALPLASVSPATAAAATASGAQEGSEAELPQRYLAGAGSSSEALSSLVSAKAWQPSRDHGPPPIKRKSLLANRSDSSSPAPGHDMAAPPPSTLAAAPSGGMAATPWPPPLVAAAAASAAAGMPPEGGAYQNETNPSHLLASTQSSSFRMPSCLPVLPPAAEPGDQSGQLHAHPKLSGYAQLQVW